MNTGYRRRNRDLKVFSGNANLPLAKEICRHLQMPLGKINLTKFSDGEHYCQILENVRGKDVFIIQPTCCPVNNNLMELLIMIDAFKRSSAARITSVIPYYGYARQDRKDKPRVPISSKLVADLLAAAGTDRILSMDLHAGQIQGFFDIPVDHLFAEPVLTNYFKSRNIDNLTIVSPDVGNIKRAARYVEHLNGDLAIIHKRRISSKEVQCAEIIGNVKERNVLMCDDIISTAGTICSAAKLVKERGAKKIFIGATHGLFCDDAVNNIKNSPIEEVIVTDTVPLKLKATGLACIKILTVSTILGEAIKRIHNNESISSMFK